MQLDTYKVIIKEEKKVIYYLQAASKEEAIEMAQKQHGKVIPTTYTIKVHKN